MALARLAFAPSTRALVSLGRRGIVNMYADDALTNADVEEMMNENLPDNEEDLKKFVLKRVMEKEAINRKSLFFFFSLFLLSLILFYLFLTFSNLIDGLLAMSAEERELYLETEGMPVQLQLYHSRAKDLHNE